MNGRNLFEKFSRQIELLAAAEKLLPKGFREKRLAKLRNRDGKIAMVRRYLLVKSLAKKVGNNVAIFPGVFLENIENLSIGDNVSIHQMCYLDADGGIEIGNNVSIAHRTTILSSNHTFSDLSVPIKYQDMALERTVLHDDIWVGCGCAILAGAEIESGCVIGANSTVLGKIGAMSVAVGSPARVIKTRS